LSMSVDLSALHVSMTVLPVARLDDDLFWSKASLQQN
jgi:hypothetical protein